MNNAIFEPLPVLCDDSSKVSARIAIMQEHGQSCHLCQLEMAVKVLQLSLLWTKEEPIVIYII